MLPRWRDEITVFASTRKVVALKASAGWGGTAPQRIEIACATGPAANAVPAALREAIALLYPPTKPARRAVRPVVKLLLSHSLAALGLVPHARALQPTELEAAARHAFTAVHGSLTREWTIAVDATSADTALAAGVDGRLIAALRSALADAGLRVGMIEPLLASGIAAARAALGGQPAWLVIEEPEQVVLARFDGAAWTSIRTHRPRRPLAADLATWLDQARLIDGVAGVDRVVVVSAARHELALLHRPGWEFVQAPLDDTALGLLGGEAA